MRPLLNSILRRFVIRGRFSVRYPDGALVTYTGAEPGPEAGIEIRTARTLRRLVIDPGLAVGEAYVDGTLVPLGCTIYDVLEVMLHNHQSGGWHLGNEVHEWGRALLRRWAQFNPAAIARRNVAHHYDLDGALYSLFLDRDRQYSCAYFAHGDETLEQAQSAKKHHIAAKLLLRPGLRVLDIGCGWGGMALTLAAEYGAEVVGVTLSEEQLATARARADAAGLGSQVRFELVDYRSPEILAEGAFDRVVSVGMFEHVGINHYAAFFRRVREVLTEDGVALAHAIGRTRGPAITNPWLAKYIFPGGYSPALSEVFPAVERSGLVATDLEVLRVHYAKTIRHWRTRFAANRTRIAELYDERFCRMFEIYLAGSELAFRRQDHMVWQMQLSRSLHTVPLTRDYMAHAPARAREDAD